MKTLDEVIAYFDNQTQQRHVYLTEDAEEIYNDALHYLKEYKKDKQIYSYDIVRRNLEVAERNDPLTWDELCEMEGEPIWIEMAPNPARWGIITEVVNTDQCKLMHVMSVDEDKYPIHIYCPKDSINPWAAYRKKRQ